MPPPFFLPELQQYPFLTQIIGKRSGILTNLLKVYYTQRWLCFVTNEIKRSHMPTCCRVENCAFFIWKIECLYLLKDAKTASSHQKKTFYNCQKLRLDYFNIFWLILLEGIYESSHLTLQFQQHLLWGCVRHEHRAHNEVWKCYRTPLIFILCLFCVLFFFYREHSYTNRRTATWRVQPILISFFEAKLKSIKVRQLLSSLLCSFYNFYWKKYSIQNKFVHLYHHR